MKDYKLKIEGNNGITYWINENWKVIAFKFSGGIIWKLKVRSGRFENYLGVVYDVYLNGNNYPAITGGKVWFNGDNISTNTVVVNSDGKIELTTIEGNETFTNTISHTDGLTYEVKSGSNVLTSGLGYISSKIEADHFQDYCCYQHFPKIEKQQHYLSIISNAIHCNYR